MEIKRHGCSVWRKTCREKIGGLEASVRLAKFYLLELRSWWGGEILGDIFGDDFAWWRYARVLEIISLNRRADFVPSFGVQWISQSIRYASTATAGQPDTASGNDENEQKVAKKVKEASPEECDQAVEGLSNVKAKAKAKQMQESQKSAESIMKRVWAMLLGIGPALRAVASMSRISSRLLVKLAKGKSLSRRERQQLTRTTADIFRLVPVAVFLIVPFMELLLPVFLKLFPNMLPSTFQDKMKEQEALKRRLNARMEYAKFLQDTVKEMAKEILHSRSGEIKKTAEDLDEFINEFRRGGRVSNDEILGFAKLFTDELTLDNISQASVGKHVQIYGGSSAVRKRYGYFYSTPPHSSFPTFC
uniref:Letm1 RBD domain-containing protein n=1 Tax=Fagus sylvatica TaxID=28930 RepID=A0A2N9F879_FAGSY